MMFCSSAKAFFSANLGVSEYWRHLLEFLFKMIRNLYVTLYTPKQPTIFYAINYLLLSKNPSLIKRSLKRGREELFHLKTVFLLLTPLTLPLFNNLITLFPDVATSFLSFYQQFVKWLLSLFVEGFSFVQIAVMTVRASNTLKD